MAWASILAEIEKCEPMCMNCHCIRTWERKTGLSVDEEARRVAALTDEELKPLIG
jgi:hypothetical protein